MIQEQKDYALEQLELDIKFGFDNEEEIFEAVSEIFEAEDSFDYNWLRQTISEKYQQHQKESLTWARPTDFDRLAKVFDKLITEKIVCLHKAGYTKQDGEGDCMESIEQLNELGIKAIGFCYYHIQDLGRAVDDEIRNLFIGFDSATQNDEEALQIANNIVTTLKENNFEVIWPGTVDERIEITNITWQKIPDDENWGSERVINILTQPKTGKKPFWKFW